MKPDLKGTRILQGHLNSWQMTPSQLEGWVIGVLDRVRTRQPVEDSRVELKSDWIEPAKAARRIAGHANASHGEPILWIVGVDETTGTVTPPEDKVANWLEQVQTFFDGVAPDVPVSLNVPYDGAAVVAILFDTTRAPFVVKNPDYGKPNGGSVEREVPWREGTKVRTARRTDLLRILVPAARVPEALVLDGSVQVVNSSTGATNCFVFLNLYFTPQGPEEVAIPFHRCSAALKAPAQPIIQLSSISLAPRGHLLIGGVVQSHTIRASESEVLMGGPGLAEFRAHAVVDHRTIAAANVLMVDLSLLPTHTDKPLKIAVECQKASDGTPEKARWVCVANEA